MECSGGGPAVAAFAVEPVRPDRISAFWKPAAGIHRLRGAGGDLGKPGGSPLLAIAKPWRGNGFGNILVDECCKDARRIGIDRVFALTYQVRFFERNGFGVVSKDLLPQRVWIVCANCPRFPDCDEVAVMRHLDAGGA
ncbi:MAG: GNAT family N-acetyltransferase [Bilophila wadsworthia]